MAILDWLAPFISGGAAIGSAIAGQPTTGQGSNLTFEQQRQLALALAAYQDPSKRAWVEEMMKKYPEFQELPIGPESMALARRMMGGELPTGVEQAYGAGAEREYGGLLSGLSDIGAGPSSLASARAGVMGKLGERVAGARERAVEQGIAFAPKAFEMGMTPQAMALAKWKAEQDIFQTTPGAAYMPGVGGGEGGVWQPGQIDIYGRKVLPPGQAYAGNPVAPAKRQAFALSALRNKLSLY
jgi:hypothetical protein